MHDFLMTTYTIALPVVLGYIVWLLKEQKETRNANSQGIKEILGYMIDRIYDEVVFQGYITTDQSNLLEGVYKAYEKLHGNGTRKHKYEYCKSVQIDDTHGSVSPYAQVYFDTVKSKGASA